MDLKVRSLDTRVHESAQTLCVMFPFPYTYLNEANSFHMFYSPTHHTHTLCVVSFVCGFSCPLPAMASPDRGWSENIKGKTTKITNS